MKTRYKLILLSVLPFTMVSCSYSGRNYTYQPNNSEREIANSYIANNSKNNSANSGLKENDFVDASKVHTSNISLTSSTFSYPMVREQINKGSFYTAKQNLRTEEVLNYFTYGYVNDTDDALTTRLELDECPWNPEHSLASVVVKAKPAITDDIKNNIVILIDRSGSMREKLSLVKASLTTLVNNLGDDDLVSIVSYAATVAVDKEALSGKDKDELNQYIEDLSAKGTTNGEAGIEKAYEIATKHFIPNGNNRVVILTDGDFNVGKVTGVELGALIETKARSNVFLTCVGYRSSEGNDTAHTLADKGNGNAYYIDDVFEASKVFEKELGKSLYVVAKDAKCQVEFSDAVSSFRLLGYETRQMSDADFENEKKDAGEIVADHTTVALYELALKEEYNDDYIFRTSLRYKKPNSDEPVEVLNTKADESVSRRADYDFMGYVAEYCLTLIDSKYKALSSYDHLLGRVNQDYIDDAYRDDFMAVVQKSKELATKK